MGRLRIADGLDEEVREREGSWGPLEFVGLGGWAVDVSILEMQVTVEEHACGCRMGDNQEAHVGCVQFEMSVSGRKWPTGALFCR